MDARIAAAQNRTWTRRATGRAWTTTVAVSLLTLGLDAPPAIAGSCQFDAAAATLAGVMTDAGLPGAGLLVGTRQGVLHERYLGGYGPDTVVALASATKLLSAVRIMQLVDRGQVGLDAPVSTWLPVFTGAQGAMTLRQMFSHSAGYGNDETSAVLGNNTITLAQATNLIACCVPPIGTPGGQFAYGGVSMHVAGRVAELATGTDWQLQWQQQVGAPLDITSIDWQGFGPTLNYRIAGGARSNLRDYGRVLHLLLNGGVGNGRRLLGAAAIATMASNQTAGLPVLYLPPTAPSSDYGLGVWIEAPVAPGAAATVSSAGAFGFQPWIDFQTGFFAVFMLRGQAGINAQMRPATESMIAAIRAELATDCTPVELFDKLFATGTDGW